MKPPCPRALLFFLLLPVLFALPLLVISAPTAAQPYLGEWSDGRGDLLVFTAGTIKFGADQAVSYHDVTRASDGHSFTLQLVRKGKLNYLSPFMRLTLAGKGEMNSAGADSFNGATTSSAHWFRDK